MSLSALRGGPLLALAALAGCAGVPPAAHPPAPVPLPARWQAVAATAPGEPAGWIATLGDPRLTALVDEALAASPDLRATLARVAAARAAVGSAAAAARPALDAGLEARRQRSTLAGQTRTDDRHTLQTSVAWEADLWGRLALGTRAARSDLAAAEADLAAARQLLAADVAGAWFAALEAEAQLALADERVASFAASVDSIAARYRRGLAEALDLSLARENLASARARRAERARQRDAARRRLEALLGRYPAAAIAPAGALPEPAAAVPAGLPAALLTRRPDVRAAAARWRARQDRATAAARNWLPGLRLTGSGGRTSDALRELLDGGNAVWHLAAALTQPLYAGGRLRAERAQAAARADEAAADYARVVLRALREVETALAAEPLLARQAARQAQAADEARQAAALAEERYRRGLTDILTLLDSRRRAFDARSRLLQVRRARLQNRIDLYLALGGDFAPPREAGP